MVGAPIDGTTTKVDRWQPVQAATQGTDDGIAAVISFPGWRFLKPGLPVHPPPRRARHGEGTETRNPALSKLQAVVTGLGVAGSDCWLNRSSAS
jgi:hypothetical protein